MRNSCYGLVKIVGSSVPINIRDFSKLHKQFLAENRVHAGILLMQQDFSIGERLYGLSVLVASITAEDISNQIIFLTSYLKKNV